MMSRAALVGTVSQEVSLTHAEPRLNPGANHLLDGRGTFKFPEMVEGIEGDFYLILIIC